MFTKKKKLDQMTIRERARYEEREMQKNQKKSGKVTWKQFFSWAFQIMAVILLAYIMVYFFGQTRTNIGQSMDLTLSGGDNVLINRLSYKIGEPKRNDIISFKSKGSGSGASYIKRIIGLPGETIQIKYGEIYIDDEIYVEQGDYAAISNPGLASMPITLGENEYFVLGDNRNNSEDSRYVDIGTVTSNNIEGKVWFIVSPRAHFGFIK